MTFMVSNPDIDVVDVGNLKIRVGTTSVANTSAKYNSTTDVVMIEPKDNQNIGKHWVVWTTATMFTLSCTIAPVGTDATFFYAVVRRT